MSKRSLNSREVNLVSRSEKPKRTIILLTVMAAGEESQEEGEEWDEGRRRRVAMTYVSGVV